MKVKALFVAAVALGVVFSYSYAKGKKDDTVQSPREMIEARKVITVNRQVGNNGSHTVDRLAKKDTPKSIVMFASAIITRESEKITRYEIFYFSSSKPLSIANDLSLIEDIEKQLVKTPGTTPNGFELVRHEVGTYKSVGLFNITEYDKLGKKVKVGTGDFWIDPTAVPVVRTVIRPVAPAPVRTPTPASEDAA